MKELSKCDFMEANDNFKSKYGIDLIREEAKILIIIEKNDGISAKQLFSFLNMSYRNFYLKLKSLIKEGKIYSVESVDDRRVKVLKINI